MINKKYIKAYEFYLKAIEQLLLLSKYETNRYNKPVYSDRGKEYAKRAKEIEEKYLEKKEKSSNEFYETQIKELRRQLDEERNKRILLENEIKNHN